MNEEYRRVPGYPEYFISRSGDLKRMERRGRKPMVRRNINGDYQVMLRKNKTYLGKFLIKDLINLTYPEEVD